MKKIIAVITMTVALASCATTPAVQRIALTPSGRPEASFIGRSPDVVQGLIASGCMNRGMLVVNSTPNQVQCEIPMNAFQATAAQLLIGNSYSTTPQSFVRFAIVPVGGDTRVQAQMWVQTQMAFGQMQQQELNSNEQFNSVQSFLMQLGGVAPGQVPGLEKPSAPVIEAEPASSPTETPIGPPTAIIPEPTSTETAPPQ